MKVLKFFGWTLLGLFVLFFVLMIVFALFDYFNDDMEVRISEKSTQKIDKDIISLYSAYFDKDLDVQDFHELMDKATESDFLLIQNSPEALYQKVDTNTDADNLYFSYVKRFPISYSDSQRLSIMDFSGLLSVATFQPQSVKKMLLPVDINWFYSFLVPSPSIQIMEFELNNYGRLYLINLENYFPKQFESSQLKYARINYLKESVIDKLAADAHVVIAGNWQNSFPGQFLEEGESSSPSIPVEWTKEGWQWVYNTQERGGYGLLISGNIEVEELKFFDPPVKDSSRPIWVRLYLK